MQVWFNMYIFSTNDDDYDDDYVLVINCLWVDDETKYNLIFIIIKNNKSYETTALSIVQNLD